MDVCWMYVTNQDLRGDWFEGSVLMQSLACLYNTESVRSEVSETERAS